MPTKKAIKPMPERRKEKRKKLHATMKKQAERIAKKGNDVVPAHVIGKGVPLYMMFGKGGREAAFKDYETLWKACVDYFQYVDANPWYKIDYKGKNVKKVKIPTATPYTIEGLCLYLGVSDVYLMEFEKHVKAKTGPASKMSEEQLSGFLSLFRAIRSQIYARKFEGGTTNTYNGNLMAWELGYRKNIVAGEGAGSALNIIVENNGDKELIESIKDQLQKIDDDAKVNSAAVIN